MILFQNCVVYYAIWKCLSYDAISEERFIKCYFSYTYNRTLSPSYSNSKYLNCFSNLLFANHFLCKWNFFTQIYTNRVKKSRWEVKTLEHITEWDKREEKLADTNEILFENNIFILKKKILLLKTIYISVLLSVETVCVLFHAV